MNDRSRSPQHPPQNKGYSLVPLRAKAQQSALDAGRRAWQSSSSPELPANGPLLRFACSFLFALVLVVAAERFAASEWLPEDHGIQGREQDPDAVSVASENFLYAKRFWLPSSPSVDVYQGLLQRRRQLEEFLPLREG